LSITIFHNRLPITSEEQFCSFVFDHWAIKKGSDLRKQYLP